jgi:hypothetical protein
MTRDDGEAIVKKNVGKDEYRNEVQECDANEGDY